MKEDWFSVLIKTVKKVTVALVTETERSEKSFDIPAEPFQKIPFTLTSKSNTNNATLEITFTGEGESDFCSSIFDARRQRTRL